MPKYPLIARDQKFVADNEFPTFKSLLEDTEAAKDAEEFRWKYELADSMNKAVADASGFDDAQFENLSDLLQRIADFEEIELV